MKITNEIERKEWESVLRAKKAHPDAEVFHRGGRSWARVRRLECPSCAREFYSWQCLENPLPQGPEPDPEGWENSRETCGSPDCHEWESARLALRHQRDDMRRKAMSGTDAEVSRGAM